MAIKKSELYSSIWKGCDELRGGMDASQYKDYVLALLFVKYVSDKYAGLPYAPISVPKGGSFADMREAKGKPGIGERLNTIIKELAKENRLEGVIDTADFDDPSKLGEGQDMQDRLTNLIAIFENPALDFSKNRAEGDDLLGDAYEYLMRNFATQSGKSKGQFYTPSEVSRVIAKIIGLQSVRSPEETIYDPTCGSGSLLLKAADEVPAEAGGITLYGQEKDNATRALAKMNMILHNQASAVIMQGNTLSNPQFRASGHLQTFDFAVANPPFSDKAWSNGIKPEEDEYNRFIDGIPPRKNGDFAFLQHLLRSLKSTGKGAIILPHGVLFRGNVEAAIRTNIVQRGYLKGIIGLPANLFYGTGIPACIIIIDKENASPQRGIFMIDASKDFMKDGNKNRLRHQDIHKIVDVFNRQIELPRYSRMVTYQEIEANDFNLNIPRYIDTTEPEDIQDIGAHLQGGIPVRDIDALAAYWQVMPALRDTLFRPNGRERYSELKVDPSAIKPTIFQHPEFVRYAEQVKAVYQSWQSESLASLKSLQLGDSPRSLIERISEALLGHFADVPLIDKYDVYQHLMSYWSDVMQDDVYVVTIDGWGAAKTLRVLIKKGKQYTEAHDIEFDKRRYRADVIPPNLLNQRYFAGQQRTIADLEVNLETVIQTIRELDDEHGAEDGLLAEAKTDSGKFTKKSITDRIKELDPHDPDNTAELALLKQLTVLQDQEAQLKDAINTAQDTLYRAVIDKYPALTEAEIKTLLVEDKWLATIEASVQSELDRVSQSLTGRIKQLAERYATPLPQLEQRAAALGERVREHLKKMGYDVQ